MDNATSLSPIQKCRSELGRLLGIKKSYIEYPGSQETIDISADAKSVRLDIYVEDGRQEE